VNRLRAFYQDCLLPMVIGALVLRALIPAGFMPGDGNALSITATLCLPAGPVGPVGPLDDNARTEQIEIPGAGHTAHCEYCVSPASGPPVFPATAHIPPASDVDIPPAQTEAPHSRFALDRAQIPRAPPRA
jgi:hypothetical protein